MPVNPYDSQSIVGYNNSPPANDGSQVAANSLNWDFHKEKLGDPVKTLAEAIDAEVLSAFAELIMTTNPAEETVVIAMQEFGVR